MKIIQVNLQLFIVNQVDSNDKEEIRKELEENNIERNKISENKNLTYISNMFLIAYSMFNYFINKVP